MSITRIDSYNHVDDFSEPVGSVEQQVSQVATESMFKGIGEAVAASRILKICLLTALVTGLVVGGLFLAHYMSGAPLGHAVPAFEMKPWMVVAAASSGVVLGFLIGTCCYAAKKKDRQKVSFEVTNAVRVFKSQNYNAIIEVNGHTLFLGALPNKTTSDAEKLKKEGVKTVLSVNEDFEKKARFLSLPYSEEAWSCHGITLKCIDAEDHEFLPIEQMHKAADWIKEGLEKGGVYVHCRAGAGRSAMAVAAYLIKYSGMSVGDATQQIERQRPISTIKKKAKGLEAFAQSIKKEN